MKFSENHGDHQRFSTVSQTESGAENRGCRKQEELGHSGAKPQIVWLRPALHLETLVIEVMFPQAVREEVAVRKHERSKQLKTQFNEF